MLSVRFPCQIAPNVVTYTSMVNMLAQAGDQASVQKALKLLVSLNPNETLAPRP